MQPVRSAKPTAWRASLLCQAKGLPVRTSAEAPITSAPPMAIGLGRSPSSTIATAMVRSGPVERASG